MFSVFGLGNPLMDYVIYADPVFLKGLGAEPGTMNLISLEEKRSLLTTARDYSYMPGGSCANTIRGIAWLGEESPIEPCVFAGAVGKDAVGSNYIRQITDLGVEASLAQKDAETGVSCVIVTPDHERTMFTYLGACREFSKEDLDLQRISRSHYFHFTGFMWDTVSQKEAMETAVKTARSEGIKVSFDLADPLAVRRYGEEYHKWIPEHVNLLFGNRDEMRLLYNREMEDLELIREIGSRVDVAVMKVGAEGCYVSDRGKITHFPGVATQVVDTVGAGDSFASGFLFGLLKNLSTDESACLANHLASGIVSVNGCDLRKLNQKDILSCI